MLRAERELIELMQKDQQVGQSLRLQSGPHTLVCVHVSTLMSHSCQCH